MSSSSAGHEHIRILEFQDGTKSSIVAYMLQENEAGQSFRSCKLQTYCFKMLAAQLYKDSLSECERPCMSIICHCNGGQYATSALVQHLSVVSVSA